jgi:predicted dehydrogenase
MIRAAIVGVGGWGQTMVSSVQGKSKRIQFTAGVTRTVSKAADFAKEKGFRLGDDYGQVLADPAIDAVILATPHGQHAEQVIQAAAAGKPVLCEKPFTLDRKSAEAAVEAMEKARLVLALGHNRRFLPGIVELKNRIDGGRMGQVVHLEANRSGSNGLGKGREGWRADPHESPAGGMTAVGVHWVDGMIHLCGPIESVHAISLRQVTKSALDDTTSMLFRFKGGMTGYLGTMTNTARTNRFEVFGSKAVARFVREEKLSIRSVEGGKPEIFEHKGFDSVRAELEAFANAIEGQCPFVVTPEQMIHGVSVLDAIVLSAESGRTVTVS